MSNTLLGRAGNSGLAAPGYVHLHFELRHGLVRVDPVPLKACHGDQLKSYPAELGKTSWSEVTVREYSVRSDGTACAAATTTTVGPGTTSTTAGGVTTTTVGLVETVGDSFRYVFNEQVANPDGSLTVYAAHLDLMGPTAIGDIYIGRVDCGFHATVSPTTTTTTPPPLLPAEVSARICSLLNGLPPLLRVAAIVQPFRLRFGCGP